MHATDVTHDIRSSARHGDWAERIGRAGLVARGVLYLLLGLVAFRVAWGDHSETADKQGALQLLREQPLGDALLVVVAVGLAAYAVWCLIEAILERPEDDGSGEQAKVWAKRAGDVGRAIVYGLVFVTAVGLLTGTSGGSSGGGQQERTLTATVLGWGTAGQLLVGAVGVAFAAGAVWNAYRAVTTDFEDDLVVTAGPGVRRAVRWVGIAGFLGRAVAFGAIGWFVIDAALGSDPNQPLGLDESLARLAAGPIGPFGLSLVALGLALFGLFSVAQARWKDLGT